MDQLFSRISCERPEAFTSDPRAQLGHSRHTFFSLCVLVCRTNDPLLKLFTKHFNISTSTTSLHQLQTNICNSYMPNHYNSSFPRLSCIVSTCGKVLVFLFDNKNDNLRFQILWSSPFITSYYLQQFECRAFNASDWYIKFRRHFRTPVNNGL